MDSFATIFRTILQGLRAAVGAHQARVRVREACFVLLGAYLGRTIRRFETLFSKWQSGTLPRPRAAQATPATAPNSAPTSLPRPRRHPFPRTRAWLLAEPEIFRLAAAAARSQLEHLFATPDFGKFLQAAPQAGRLLRPLCHMLGITATPDIPAVLALPPPPRVRPAPPSPRPYPAIIDPPDVDSRYQALVRTGSAHGWRT